MQSFLIVLVIAIALLIILIGKLNVHPVLGLFIAALFAGVGLGYNPLDAMNMIANGFGSTMTSIGITIMFGCIIAEAMRDTNAMKSLINFFIKLFKGKFLELPTALSAFIVSIPVFGDVTGILLAPTASSIGKRAKKSMSVMGAFNGLASALTHGVVPPTPGILAVSILCGANLGLVIGYGTIICLIAFLVTWMLYRNWIAKDWIEPREDFVAGVEPINSDNYDYHELLLKDKFLPPVLVGILPISIPVILIASSSFIALSLPEGNAVRNLFTFIGDRNIAMFLGLVSAILIGYCYKNHVVENYNIYKNANETSATNVMLQKWVANALNIALIPLLVTSMGGAFSAIIKSYPGIEDIGLAVASINFPKIFVPFIIAAVLMVAVGSQTTAGMTAAAICVPMMADLGLTPEALTLTIGAGTLIGNHLNNSGFWSPIVFYNFTVKQNLKYSTIPWATAAVILFVEINIFRVVGLM